jgi:hypothetical protein
MAITDYNTECGAAPLGFWQLLASTIFGYHDIQGLLHYRLNTSQTSVNCGGLTDPLTCKLSHIESERWLVENVFALDDCSLLSLKVISNGDNDWIDYEECGEVPLSLFQLMARTVRTSSNVTYLNAVIDSAACGSLTQLLDCNVNNVEAERLLVANLFATDDCGNLLIKMVADSSTMTDYHTGCEEYPQSLLQLLARCIVSYSGHYYLNVASVTGYCNDLHAFWTCSNNYISPERALVENIFATDSCGNLAIKIFNNQGSEDRQ